MTNENKLFFPLFYNTLELTKSFSDKEFGELIRELLKSEGRKEYAAKLGPELSIAYNFMLDNAVRLFDTYSKQKSPRKNTKAYGREYNFDPEEAFEKALARSYGDVQ